MRKRIYFTFTPVFCRSEDIAALGLPESIKISVLAAAEINSNEERDIYHDRARKILEKKLGEVKAGLYHWTA